MVSYRPPSEQARAKSSTSEDFASVSTGALSGARELLKQELQRLASRVGSEVQKWCAQHSGQVRQARVIGEDFGRDHFTVRGFIQSKSPQYNAELEDALSNFDIELSNRYDGVYLDLMPVPTAELSGLAEVTDKDLVYPQH